MQMEEEQNSNNTFDIDTQILEELQKKKTLIDKQLQILADIEQETKDELNIWEEKCKNLRQIYNYYNYSQAQYQRTLISKEPMKDSKLIEPLIQNQVLPSNQIQQLPQVQISPLKNQLVDQFESNKSKFQFKSIQGKQNNELLKKVVSNHSSHSAQDVQNKNIDFLIEKNQELEIEEEFEEQKEDQKYHLQKAPDLQNKIELKQIKTPLNNPDKKIVATSNRTQDFNDFKGEKKQKNQVKKFKFPKNQISIEENNSTQTNQKDDKSQYLLDNHKTFEQYMEKYIKKFPDDSPQSIKKQLEKARKIKLILNVPDEKLIITHKWLSEFKIQIYKTNHL